MPVLLTRRLRAQLASPEPAIISTLLARVRAARATIPTTTNTSAKARAVKVARAAKAVVAAGWHLRSRRTASASRWAAASWTQAADFRAKDRAQPARRRARRLPPPRLRHRR